MTAVQVLWKNIACTHFEYDGHSWRHSCPLSYQSSDWHAHSEACACAGAIFQASHFLKICAAMQSMLHGWFFMFWTFHAMCTTAFRAAVRTASGYFWATSSVFSLLWKSSSQSSKHVWDTLAQMTIMLLFHNNAVGLLTILGFSCVFGCWWEDVTTDNTVIFIRYRI